MLLQLTYKQSVHLASHAPFDCDMLCMGPCCSYSQQNKQIVEIHDAMLQLVTGHIADVGRLQCMQVAVCVGAPWGL